jgi:hypothetical protein
MDVVQLVRTLPRHSLESYTVTANSLPHSTKSQQNRDLSSALLRIARFSLKRITSGLLHPGRTHEFPLATESLQRKADYAPKWSEAQRVKPEPLR